MALTPMTLKEQELTIKNVVSACRDITKLNKRGYNFLYLASGFIAHYNLHGFISHYENGGLKQDILANQSNNQYHNFREGEANYEYYMSKKHTYNAICLKLKENNQSFIG